MRAKHLSPGSLVAGAFEIVRWLGNGPASNVYEARDRRRAGARCAVKICDADNSARRAESLARLQQEAGVLGRLRHANIVASRGWQCLPDGSPMLVMEMLDGESLETRLRSGSVDAGLAEHVIASVGSALEAAHGASIFHCSLKPSNIFLVPDERGGTGLESVRLLDFGACSLAPAMSAIKASSSPRSMPQYLAPEQVQGQPADARTDEFALAAIAYELYSGRQPFAADSYAGVLVAVTKRDPPPLASVAPPVAAAIRKALEKDPAKRYPSVSSFLRAWEGRDGDAASTMSMPAMEPAGGKPVHGERKRWTRQATIALSSFGLALLLGVVVVTMRQAFRSLRDEKALSLRKDTGVAPNEMPADFVKINPDRFDVTGFVARATEMAKKISSEATLAGIEIDVSGVQPDGTVDLAHGQVTYRFQSPRRLPSAPGTGSNPACAWEVVAGPNGNPSVHPVEGRPCDGPLIDPPECSLKEIWQRALTRGQPSGKLGYGAGPGGRKQWWVPIARSKDGRAYAAGEWMADDCAKAPAAATDEDFLAGLNLVGAGHCKEAISRFQHALEKDTSSVEVHYYLGVCYAAIGKEKQAAYHYEVVLHLRPDHEKADKLKAILHEYFQRSAEKPRWRID